MNVRSNSDVEDSPDWEVMLALLANEQRRRLVVSLLEHNPQDDYVRIPEDGSVAEKDLEVLQTELVHNHLPKLVEAGYVHWDGENHRITKGPNFDELRPLLELIHDHRDELPDGWI